LADPVRYKLTLAYRGTNYHGWQKQVAAQTWRGHQAVGEDIPTVQLILRRAIVSVIDHPINLVGSSRTDSGVHAKGQVAQFDTTSTQIPLEGLRRAINARLPDDIVVHSIEPTHSTFDVIQHTRSKRYQYLIWNALNRPVFASDLCWHRWQKLNLDAMTEAASLLVGTHDFASFAKVGHGRENTIRTILECSISHRSPRLVISVHGTGFLWQMVRIIVGTLVQVGLDRCTPAEVQNMLDAKDRREGGPTAPPQGLYLQWIRYKGD